mgnify:FL=1
MGKSFNDRNYPKKDNSDNSYKKKPKHKKMEPYKRNKMWIDAPRVWIDYSTVLSLFMKKLCKL